MTVTDHVEILPVAAGNNPGHPAVAVLPDGTILMAWQNLDTGVITITHYATDLTATDTTTITEPPVGGWSFASGLGLLPTGEGARLAYGTGPSWDVTTNPLAVTAAGDLGWTEWGYYPSSVAVVGDHTFTVCNDRVFISGPGGVTSGTLPAGAASTATPTGSGGVTVAVDTTAGEEMRYSLYPVDASGVVGGIVESGPAQATSGWHGSARPGLYVGMENLDANGELLTVRAQDGTILNGRDWPDPTTRPWATGWHASLATDDGGILAEIPWSTLQAPWLGGRSLVHIAADGTHTALADLHVAPNLTTANWSRSATVATNGRTAAFAAVILEELPTRLGISLWTVELTPTYHGVLHIDTLTHPYWLVGTADPDMAYRLHIDTGTEWLTEILAGQEDQATYRLRVCDGTDWHTAAYMRPE